MSDAPEKLEDSKKKIEKIDANLSMIYANFVEKTGQDYADKLFKFLFESPWVEVGLEYLDFFF